MKRYFAGIMACLMLGIYGCSSGGGITTTSNSVDTTKTASVKLAADFGGGEVQTAFYKDIDNITITYSAGCAETQNYFEYYFVDNRTADLYKSGSIFLNSFFDSLYDLWVKTKLAELDNISLDNNSYYNPGSSWTGLDIRGSNCTVNSNTVILTKDNNTATIQLPTGYANFIAEFYKNGVVVERTGTRGKLVEGNNDVKIATLRGSWTLATPFTSQISSIQTYGISINKFHLSSQILDFPDSIANMIGYYLPLYDNNTLNYLINDRYLPIANKYKGTNIYKTQGEPFRTSYYLGVFEATYDNGTGAITIPIPTYLKNTQSFKGGTGTDKNWNGIDNDYIVELSLPDDKTYNLSILGFKINTDNNSILLTKEPITSVNGDTISGWMIEGVSKKVEECYLRLETGWVKLNSCGSNYAYMYPSKVKSSVASALIKVSKSALYPIAEGCVDNLTESWTDLDYQYSICYNSDNNTFYAIYSLVECNPGYSKISNAYIKKIVNMTIEKGCMKKFSANRDSKFDFSNILSDVEVIISNKK